MSWEPPARPDWVRALEDADTGPLAEEAALPLTRDGLLGEAAARQGVDAGPASFGRPGFEAEPALENLDRLLRALDEEAALHRIGRFLTRRFLLRLLEVRLQLMAWLDHDPAVQDEEIAAPLFVAGAPRTGTTILHALLAADPRHRVPRGWELLRPLPPPEPGTPDAARVELASRELVAPQNLVSGLRSIHEYGGRKPKECLSAMSFAFQSEEFTARYAVPSYEGWLVGSDMTPAYRMHRLVLQVLQRRQPTTQWVLKSPVHLHSLPTLFSVYPDARVAVTHRDPVTLLASLTSLIANLRWAHSDGVDPTVIADAHVERYRTSLAQLVAWDEAGALPADRTHHSRFAEFQQASLAVVTGLYARFGMPWGDALEQRLRETLAENASHKPGGHRYAREVGSHSLEALRGDFAAYQRHFDVPSDD